MANDPWVQIPTNLLDLGQRAADAEEWASAQRAQLAQTWANVQRQALSAVASTFQDQNPAPSDQGIAPSMQSGPQAAGVMETPYDTSAALRPQQGVPNVPEVIGDVGNAALNQYNQAAQQTTDAFEPTSTTTAPGLLGPRTIPQYTDQQKQAQLGLGLNAALGISGADSEIAKEAQPLVQGATDLARQDVGGLGQAVGNVLGGVQHSLVAPKDSQIFYHGTGSAFQAPDAAKFDPNGLFGPGYYVTSDARVANSYATNNLNAVQLSARQGQLEARLAAVQKQLDLPNLVPNARAAYEKEADALRTQLASAGPNVRAVSVPNGLKLLDADAPIPGGLEQSIQKQLRGVPAFRFSEAMDTFDKPTGQDIWRALNFAYENDPELVNQVLAQQGYDGIQYAGGKRIPLQDANGNAIEHTAINVFPQSIGKLRNAISGQMGGLVGAGPSTGDRLIASALKGGVGGAIAGGTAASQEPNATPGSIGAGALGGAGIGVAQGLGLEGVRSLSGGRVSSTPMLRIAGETANQGANLGDEAQRAGNILLSKLPEDVRGIVQDAYNQAPDLFETARRGVLSDQTVNDLADQVGANVNKIVQRWQPGQAQNAETLLALRQTLASKAQDVLNAQQAIQQGGNSSENLLKLQLALKEHQAVQEAVAGTTAEAGRALRQFRQTVTGAIASGNSSQMEALLKKMGGREWTEELAQRLSQIDTSDPTQVYQFIRDTAKPNAKDYLTEYFYNSILSAPSTHIANAVSNTVSALSGAAERGVAAAVDIPLSKVQGRPRERFFGEVQPYLYGLLQGLPDGARGATYVLKNGFSLDDALKGEVRSAQAFRGPVGNAINMPSRMLGAADQLYRGVLYRANLNAEAYRLAASQGLKGDALAQRVAELMNNPPADLIGRVGKLADYQLYRQEPKQLTKALVQLRGINLYGIEPLRFVIPFLQTPVNITKYGLERSPLGWLNPDLYRNLFSGNAAAADNISRALMGSLITGAIGSMVGTGQIDITGAVPTNPSERDAFYRQGKQPFGLKIGNQWYSYQRWEPFNQGLTQVAAAVDAIRNAKLGQNPTDIATQAALAIGQNLVSQTYLSGINSVLNAMSDPVRYGTQWVDQTAGAIVPMSGFSRTAANLTDSRQRAPKGIVQSIESNVPVLSQQVPARLNNFGEQEQQQASPILPYKSSAATTDPLEQELERLQVNPGATGRTLRGIDLTPQEQRDYLQTSGQLVHQTLQKLVSDPRYQGLSDTQKAAALQRTINLAKEAGAKAYLTQLVNQIGRAAFAQRLAAKKKAS